MATGRSSFAKRQRDMAKKAKAAAKREKKFDRDSTASEPEPAEEPSGGPKRSNEEIMAAVEDLHRRYDDGQMDLNTFDEEKAALMAEFSID